MTRGRPPVPTAVALVVAVCAGWPLSSCSRTELKPAPELASPAPQQFADGPGVVVIGGSPSPDQTPDGPLWWFTSAAQGLSVYNGSATPAMLRVSADVVVPCQTPARVEFSLPNGHMRRVDAATGRPGRLRFGVQVPARGAVDVGVQVKGSACKPPNDPRTLYAGVRSLRARVGGPDGSPAPESSP